MPDQLPTSLLTEDDELKALREKWSKYPKLSMWFDLYFDASNKQTFNNRTESAIIAYQLDPNDPHDRKTAHEIGSQNSRKLKSWAVRYYEQTGWTKEKVLDLIANKAVLSNNAKYTVMLAELTDTWEEKPKITINSQTNINNIVQVTPEEEARLDKAFADFMTQSARTTVINANPLPQPDSSNPTSG